MGNTRQPLARVQALRDLASKRFGLSFPENADALIASRVEAGSRMTGGLAGVDPLGCDDESVLESLVETLLTSHSYFYREPVHFDFLKSAVFPELDQRLQHSGGNQLRVWSAGSAAGQEAYTLIMMMREYFGDRYDNLDAGVLATDISTRALRDGVAGVYRADALRHLPADYVQKYVEPGESGNTKRIARRLRDDVTFRWLNLAGPLDMLKGGFDIVFCRNVMIYFEPEVRASLVLKFWELIRPGGYLFIGLTDGAGPMKERFQLVQPSVFRKRD